MRHLTAVAVEKHNRFADENSMHSYLMSAKSGDQVKQAFHKIACNLANIPLVEQTIETSVVTATIIDSKRHGKYTLLFIEPL